jgi:hypothetical protein
VKIYYVNGVAGSFKTTRALEWAAKFARIGNKIIIASPAMNLIEQSFDNAIKLGATCYRFDSATHPDTVYADLCAFMKEPHDGGCIVFITHKCLFDLPYWGPHKRDWHLIVDEIPQIDRDWCWNLSHEQTVRFLLDPLEVRDVGRNLYLRLLVKDDQEGWLRKVATNKHDDTMLKWMHEYRDLAQDLLSPNVDVWVSRASWNQLKYRGEGKLHIHATVQPGALEGWASVQIMGAHFDDSVLKMVWETQGVSLKPSKVIKADRDAHDETLGKRIVLHSFGDKRWSKKLFAKLGEHSYVDEAAVKALWPVIEKVVGGEPFIYAVNNDLDDKVIEARFTKAKRVPNNPHGLNSFQDYTKAVFLTCLNNRSPHFAFLRDMYDIEPEQLAKARYFEFAYQFFMRSAARAAGSDATCHFVIPSGEAAHHFTKVFPGCTWKAIETHKEIEAVIGSASLGRRKPRRSPGRPKAEHTKSGAARVAAHRQKMARLDVTKMGIGNYLFSLPNQPIAVTQEASIYSYLPDEVVANEVADWEDFRAQMRGLAEQFCPRKEDATLVSGASFAPLLGETSVKALANVTQIWGVWFDVEGGEMRPEEWQVIFPEQKFLAFNSFNNGKNGELRYRVIFPSLCAIGAEDYHYVWDRMADRIRQAGYFVGRRDDYEKLVAVHGTRLKFSGIDASKRTANSFFYLPSRPKLGKKYAFWFENWGDGTAILDPLVFLDYAAPAKREYEIEAPYRNPGSNDLRRLQEALASSEPADFTQRAIDEALAEWGSGKPGHGEFLKLGKRLSKYMTVAELAATLRQEAARDPQDTRRKEVRGILLWVTQR